MPDDKVLCCDCGYEVPAPDEGPAVEAIRSHARDAHGIVFTVDEAHLVLRRSQIDVPAGSFTRDTRRGCASSTKGER